MLHTIPDIVARIVDFYDPDRIILFGSHARGEASAVSDVDLLVVKETAERPIDRRIAVERSVADRALALDIVVYTPGELRRLFEAGSPFAEEVMETGRVVYMRHATESWLREVDGERDAAQVLLRNRLLRAACLHAQQCVEKSLKAYLVELGVRPPKTHDLLDLQRSAAERGWTIAIAMDDLIFLNSVYRGRYPTEEGLLPSVDPTDEDATRAVRVADLVAIALRERLSGHVQERLD